MNGVINIITKPAAETHGPLVSLAGGNEDRGSVGLRFGGRLGDRGNYRVYSKYSERRPLLDAGGERDEVASNSLRSGFRADWSLSGKDSLTIEADLFRAHSGTELSFYGLQAPFEQILHGVEHGAALANWTQQQSSRSKTAVRVYIDRSVRSDPVLSQGYSTIDVDFQHELALSASNDLVWGLGFRNSAIHADGTSDLTFRPDRRNERLFSGFVQDQWRLFRDRLSLIVGSKFENNNFAGANVQPTARLLWTPDARNTVWASVSRAVRNPSYVENSARATQRTFAGEGGLPTAIRFIGDPAFRSEDLLAYEFGYRLQARRRFSLDLDTFYNNYHHLGATRTGAPFFEHDPRPHLIIPLRENNAMHGAAYGAEIASSWNITERWRLIPSYTWLQLELLLDPGSQEAAEATEGQSPRHAFQIRSNLDISRRLQFDAAIYHMGALRSLDVDSYTRVDARLGYWFRPNLEISVGAQNLQGGRHVEFDSLGPYSRAAVGRSFSLKLTLGVRKGR